jgi:Cofactor assembly of complex C subunit B, CCB2/CCB4
MANSINSPPPNPQVTVKSDDYAWLKQLPIVVGSLASILLVTNRILTPALTNSQSRSDALGIILSAVLVLTGLLWQQVQPPLPESVVLVGEEGFELDETLPESLRTELAWATHLLLTNTVTKSIVVYRQGPSIEGKVLLRRGILGKNPQVTPGPILDRVLKTQKPVYLVSLKLYPGRIEFDYLPENTQGVICQPIGEQSVMILGANAPRNYTKQDEAWVAGIADKLAHSFQSSSTLT